MRPAQKAQERLFAERASALLNAHWILQAGEGPDFHVTCSSGEFGLEVVQIFAGRRTRRGSRDTAQEARNDRLIAGARSAYETDRHDLLSVRIVGPPSQECLSELAGALARLDTTKMALGESRRIKLETGHTVYVTKGSRTGWVWITDRVGWIKRDGSELVQRAIKERTEKLHIYRSKDFGEVRLLVVADRRTNSGKILLADSHELDTGGFQAVYFLSYPDDLVMVKSQNAG